MYKVYVAILERTDACPEKVLKVGITRSDKAIKRFRTEFTDGIKNYFPDITIVIETDNIYTEREAKYIERKTMSLISNKWHDWYEKDHISGITEMRVYRREEEEKVREIIEGLPLKSNKT